MKHIKSFNESKKDEFAVELREFCKNNLAYLIDEGFEYYTDFCGDDEFLLYINSSKNVKFNDILPDFIPFVELLSEKVNINGNISIGFYNISDDSMYGYDPDLHRNISGSSRKETVELTIDQILNDELNNPIFNIPYIITIKIDLEKKKVSTLNRIKSFFKK